MTGPDRFGFMTLMTLGISGALTSPLPHGLNEVCEANSCRFGPAHIEVVS
jgi:hypothetical protein